MGGTGKSGGGERGSVSRVAGKGQVAVAASQMRSMS